MVNIEDDEDFTDKEVEKIAMQAQELAEIVYNTAYEQRLRQK